MATNSYLEQCVNAMYSFDPSEIAERRVGTSTGAGSSATVYPVGELPILGSSTPVCLKLLEDDRTTVDRLVVELSSAAIIATLAPPLTPLLPKFMGIVAVEDYGPIGIITEDASHGGTHAVTPIAASPQAMALLAKGFPEDAKGLLKVEVLNEVTAFSADGQERWLDFTPSPIERFPKQGAELRSQFDKIEADARKLLIDLTLEIRSDTDLAMSVIDIDIEDL